MCLHLLMSLAHVKLALRTHTKCALMEIDLCSGLCWPYTPLLTLCPKYYRHKQMYLCASCIYFFLCATDVSSVILGAQKQSFEWASCKAPYGDVPLWKYIRGIYLHSFWTHTNDILPWWLLMFNMSCHNNGIDNPLPWLCVMCSDIAPDPLEPFVFGSSCIFIIVSLFTCKYCIVILYIFVLYTGCNYIIFSLFVFISFFTWSWGVWLLQAYIFFYLFSHFYWHKKAFFFCGV